MNVAPFIDVEDHVPMILCFSMYGKNGVTTLQQYGGYNITGYGSLFTRCWTKGGSVIIGVRGTAPGEKGFVSNLVDDITLAVFSQQVGCDLKIVADAKPFVQEFIDRGFCEIIVCGHSLGGNAAMCLGKEFSEVTRVITFNGAAPPTSDWAGVGRERSKAYHIVGDLISTHLDDWTADVRRMQLIEPEGTNWGDPAFYHSTDRFLETRPVRRITNQQEETDLMTYIFKSANAPVTVTMGVLTKHLSPARLKEFFCAHPIPGTSFDLCKKNFGDAFLEAALPVLGLIGGALLGALTGGLSIAAGAIIGSQIGSGYGLLDLNTSPYGVVDVAANYAKKGTTKRPKGRVRGYLGNET